MSRLLKTEQSNHSVLNSGEYLHLDEDIIVSLSYPDAARIRMIKSDEWFSYQRAKEILKEMELLLELPSSLRSPGLLITALPNNGKSWLVHHFAKKHPAEERADGTGVNVPVVLINSPHKPDVGWFLGNILLALNAPHKTKEKEEVKFNQVIGLFERLNVRMLIADEISDTVDGTALQQRHFLNMLKSLNNEMRRPIILTATPRIKSALALDEQVKRRFSERELPEWVAGIELINFLAAFEKRTPLKYPSELASKKNRALALKILEKSHNRIGYIVELLQKSAEKAIITGTEKINEEIIDSVKLQN